MALLEYPATTVRPEPSECSEVIEYVCERCQKRFDPPTPRTSLPWWQDVAPALGRRLHRRQGPSPQEIDKLARINGEAFQAFVAGFALCYRCRRFVCPRCWNGNFRRCHSCINLDVA